MVADIQILQGKIVDDLDRVPKNFTKLMEELTLEILSDEDLAGAAITPQTNSDRGQA